MENVDTNKVEWRYIIADMDEHQKRDLLRHAPDQASLNRLAQADPSLSFPHLYQNKTADLAWSAVERAHGQLESIRKQGIMTHATGHAAAFLFKKCLDVFEGQHVHEPGPFRDFLMRHIEELRNAFEPIFEVLTSGITIHEQPYISDAAGTRVPSIFREDLSKREKKVLIRAFWPMFDGTLSRFRYHNWKEIYRELWDQTFESLYKGKTNGEETTEENKEAEP